MMERQVLLDNITDQLSRFQCKIGILNKNGLNDANIHAQDVVCRLFNVIYGFQLVNLNRDKVTIEAIDLGDKENRVAVQVTSENSSTKIKETIDLFIKKRLYADYDRLIIAIIGSKKKYTSTFNTGDTFQFDKRTDIIDTNCFVSDIKNCPLDKQREILNILEEELDGRSVITLMQQAETVDTLEKKITARCRSKLISVGVTSETASEIINKDVAGNRYNDILEAEKEGTVYLQGEFGCGKSHALMILALRMMKAYRIDNCNPIPLYVTADSVIKAGGIQEWMQTQIQAKSYYVFIDGCDEMSKEEADRIAEEVLYLQYLWKNVHFIMCGRPLQLLSLEGKKYQMPCLSEDQVAELIALVSRKEIVDVSMHLRSVEHGIKETLKRPFFALLYAILLQQSGVFFRTSYSDLISRFVNWSLNKCGDLKSSVTAMLEQIAILSVDRNIGKIHISEIKGNDLRIALQQTGFIVMDQDNTVHFPLPIFAQWFAAEGILHERISIDEILDDKARSSRWRYAFSLMFSKMTFDESVKYFSKIVNKDIGIVAEVINNGTIDEGAASSESALECGKKIRICMEIWMNALGKLAQVLVPCEENALRKLAIDVDGCGITTTWSSGKDADDVTVLSPRDQLLWSGYTESRGIYSQATWPWIYTFNQIKERLKKTIDKKSLLCDNTDILTEYVWSTSLSLLGIGSLYQDPVSLEKIEQFRKFRNIDYIKGRSIYRLNTFFSIVDQMYGEGKYEIQPAVPVGDKAFGGLVWSHYSEKRMLERVTAIYQKALYAYNDYATGWFSSFASRMRTAVLMPVVFHGNLKYKEEGRDHSDGPSLTWHMEAAPEGTANRTDITLNKPEEEGQWEIDSVSSVLRKDIINRPLQREWLHATICSEGIRCFEATPITDVVYKWLKEDLKEINWI